MKAYEYNLINDLVKKEENSDDLYLIACGCIDRLKALNKKGVIEVLTEGCLKTEREMK